MFVHVFMCVYIVIFYHFAKAENYEFNELLQMKNMNLTNPHCILIRHCTLHNHYLEFLNIDSHCTQFAITNELHFHMKY